MDGGCHGGRYCLLVMLLLLLLLLLLLERVHTVRCFAPELIHLLLVLMEVIVVVVQVETVSELQLVRRTLGVSVLRRDVHLQPAGVTAVDAVAVLAGLIVGDGRRQMLDRFPLDDVLLHERGGRNRRRQDHVADLNQRLLWLAVLLLLLEQLNRLLFGLLMDDGGRRGCARRLLLLLVVVVEYAGGKMGL
uniref:Secreted protein n=1 Tax=Anopheles farauti TaxID=69004 RepID=A0A182Q914_9DIPT